MALSKASFLTFERAEHFADGLSNRFRARPNVRVEARAFLGNLRLEPAIADENRQAATHDQKAVLAGESGQVAHVDLRRDEERIGADRLEPPQEAVPPQRGAIGAY